MVIDGEATTFYLALDLYPHLTFLCFPMIQVTTGGRASYYVSYRREAFAQIKLPKYSLPKVFITCCPGSCQAKQQGEAVLSGCGRFDPFLGDSRLSA